MDKIATLAIYELRASVRNRWFVLYTLTFTILASGLSYLSLSGAGLFGFAGFGRTAASLINLVLLIVPLMGLTVGAMSVAGEREQSTLSYLLAQPIGRGEVLLGKFLGLGLALATTLLLGFGLAGILIARQSSTVEADRYLALAGISLLLALVSLSLGLVISVASRRGSLAVGVGLFVWLLLVFLADLGLMGTAVAMRLDVGTLLTLALLNPLQVFKIAAVQALQASLEVLGPAGLYATRTFGDGLMPLLLGVLFLWVLVPLGVAHLIFAREGDV